MCEVNKKNIYETVLGIINELADDWEYDCEITPDTLFVGDLGLESIDVVILGTTIQNHYGHTLPFAEFLAEVGRREVRDIRIDEFVEFVHQNLNGKHPA
jgi:acyl carrier protein